MSFIAPAGGFGLGGETLDCFADRRQYSSPQMSWGGDGSANSLGSDLSMKGGGSSGGGSVASSVAEESSRRNDADDEDGDDDDYDSTADLLEQSLECKGPTAVEEKQRGSQGDAFSTSASSVPSAPWPERKLDDDRSPTTVAVAERPPCGGEEVGLVRNDNGNGNWVWGSDAGPGGQGSGRESRAGGSVGLGGLREDGTGADTGLRYTPIVRADSGGVSPLAGLSYANSPRLAWDLASAASRLESAVIPRDSVRDASEERREPDGGGDEKGEVKSPRSSAEAPLTAEALPALTDDEDGKLLPTLSTEGLEPCTGGAMMGPVGSMWAAGARGTSGDGRDSGGGGSLAGSHSHSSGEMWYSPTPSSVASATAATAGAALSSSSFTQQAGARGNVAPEPPFEVSVSGTNEAGIDDDGDETFQLITPPPQSIDTGDEAQAGTTGLEHLP